MKTVIFGAGITGEKTLADCKDGVQISFFVDNNSEKWGKHISGHPVRKPEILLKEEYDRVVIAIDDTTLKTGEVIGDILKQLDALNVPMSKVMLSSPYGLADRRVDFLIKLSKILLENKVEGAIAECGVYRGYFSGHMNECFPEKKLYLFDTFEGFDDRDIKLEVNLKSLKWYKDDFNFWKKDSSAEAALLRCPYRENVVVKKGYVPETFSGLEEERFAFVNLDMDLYAPMLAALRFFVPRLEYGGVVLLHDYYYPSLPGVKQAVDEFAKEWKYTIVPIGDDCSIALIPEGPVLEHI